MNTVNLLIRLVEHHQVLVYFLIFVGIIFEGEFILLCTGILMYLGALNFYFTFIFVLMGGLSKTFLGYYIGSFIYNKWNHIKFFKYIEKRVFNIMPHFEQKPFWSIFVSKFIMMNHMVIVYAGYKKIDFKKYLKAEILATAIWAPLLLSLGYVFSYTALQVSREIWRFSMVVLVLFIMFILFDKLVSWLYELFEEFYNDNN
ncbi:MAG: hypothetical protein UU82_C0024G0007 [Candidatus Nomurabacteria bacterium GW2011_GWC2_41_8]|uniref:VTT domain-containing protein n=2 Tax=Candidatus Nomuraibacteriota TaxID=1752729 RepID=A0A0G0XGU6_9BACT|nr:MAG: hypothetical protein UU58_C0007G0036 [Candidatus Nomurabacteria bacterium GW2011_GWA2_41_25]KKS23637.1 MAG: hypothetical protein UU82_C0024G0007 [Candidatus Nomurabacteria bacterium GW2011_GWC2_41_8]OGI66907.1 MAG: hypothetical protein A2823_01385 [Candidatus Nomurabacteria bacterium RIFCSPHIGHO2_01_FULL_41_91]OGI80618.1 MAG: hypothetical protein A3D43_02720 [Candidatus Nomurabacteria bacterium RIFCSPHIGHO2_02_FULL_41_52]OGI85217.1 MAG: hypothetical protein A3F49_00830 [Candidatus Nomur